MYAIYKSEANEHPVLVGVCLTKRGADKACRHFTSMYNKETNGRTAEVTAEEVMYYPLLKKAYTSLCRERDKEQKKLESLRQKECIAANNTFAQECKVANLYV